MLKNQPYYAMLELVCMEEDASRLVDINKKDRLQQPQGRRDDIHV